MTPAIWIAAMIATTSPPGVELARGRGGGFVCFSDGEQESGFNRICFYDCAGSRAAITIGATELCPLSIRR